MIVNARWNCKIFSLLDLFHQLPSVLYVGLSITNWMMGSEKFCYCEEIISITFCYYKFMSSNYNFLVVRLLVSEAEATLEHLSIRLDAKWWQPYSWACGYVRSRPNIKMVHETHIYIQGYLVPARRIIMQCPQWEDDAIISLYW